MTSADTTADRSAISISEERTLRYPKERPIFIAGVLFNVAIIVAALTGVDIAAERLASYPRLAGRVSEIRTIATLAVFLPPAILLLRNWRIAFVRGNSVQLSPTQLPEIYGILEAQCTQFGMAVPELYLTEDSRYGDAKAFSTLRRNCIVLSSKYVLLEHAQEKNLLSFLIGSELGRIRLGHTKWWHEVLAAYTLYVPILKNPLLKARTYSSDRYGARLSPGPLDGLIVHATSWRALRRIDVDEYLAQARAYGGFWARVSELGQSRPHLAYRIQNLERAE